MAESFDGIGLEISVIRYRISLGLSQRLRRRYVSVCLNKACEDVMATHKVRQDTVNWITVDYFLTIWIDGLNLDPN